MTSDAYIQAQRYYEQGATAIALHEKWFKPLDQGWRKTTHKSVLEDFHHATDQNRVRCHIGVKTGKEAGLVVVEFRNSEELGRDNGLELLKDQLWPFLSSEDLKPTMVRNAVRNTQMWCLWSPKAPASTEGLRINGITYNINIYNEDRFVVAPPSQGGGFVRCDGDFDRSFAMDLSLLIPIPEVVLDLLTTGRVRYVPKPQPVVIEESKGPAKTLAKVSALVAIINPYRAQDPQELCHILWAIAKALNWAAGYRELAHGFAIKALPPDQYVVEEIDKIIAKARKHGSGYCIKFLEAMARDDNITAYKNWVNTYLTKKAKTKEEERQADQEQSLTQDQLGQVLIESLQGHDKIMYCGEKWKCWSGEAGFNPNEQTKILLWLETQPDEARSIMRSLFEEELRARDFNIDKIRTYATDSQIKHLIGKVKLATRVDEFPASPEWAFPILDGLALELKTGLTRDRTSQDYFTFETKIDLNLVTHQGLLRVAEFFRTISYGQDPDFQAWLTNHLLYCLSGQLDPKRPSVLCLEGRTRNGKSTILKTMLKILGDYGASLPQAVLFDKDNQGRAHDTHTLQLNGKRCVVFSELGTTKVNAETLKRITGKDEITGRGANQTNFERFDSVAKILMAANVRLNLKFDPAITRRVKCVKILAEFVDQPDATKPNQFQATDVDDWLITPEGKACFVKYLVDNGQGGKILPIPNLIREIAEENEDNSQPSHEIYINEALEFDQTAAVKLSHIWNNYLGWLIHETKERSTHQNDFGKSLKDLIPGVYRTGGNNRSYRVRLLHQYT